MLRRPSLVRAAVLVIGVVAGVSLTGVPHAVAVTSHRALNDTRAVGARPVQVDFPIEYLGVVADLPTATSHLSGRGTTPYGEARFRVHGRWTPWQAFDQDGAQAAGHFTSALLHVDRADAYQVRGVPSLGRHWRVAAINTTDGPHVVVGHRSSDAAVAAAPCMSRADWGADESISGWARGDIQTYYPVQALTVHHTAGSNDLGQDYAATVRAIYSFHVQTNGWSDIGYQYLVDGTGKVYEGRSSGHTSVSCLTGGGDGSDFAHQSGTDSVVTGAHVAGWNSGNVGVALMGCYEPTSACSGSTTPPAAAVDGLERLLASLSARHGLDPRGTVHFVNPVSGATKDVATISGHRDWEATACPGGKLYAQLGTIRSDVAVLNGAPPPAQRAAITSASCTRATCTFGGVGTGTLRWTFGNGKSAQGTPVSATYTAKGAFTVTLTDSQTPSTQATRSVTCRLTKGTLACTT